MKGISVVAIALSVLTAVVGLASAAETQAKARGAHSSDRVIVLSDGTKVWPAEDLIVERLQEGVTVGLVYEKRDGKHVVTRIETAE